MASNFVFLLVLSLLGVLMFFLLPVESQHPVVVFTQWSYSGKVAEKQPAGTKVVTVQAYYFTVDGKRRSDGYFHIPTDGDGRFFTVTTDSTDYISTGPIQTAVILDKNTANKTEFQFSIWYITPLNASTDAGVSVVLTNN